MPLLLEALPKARPKGIFARFFLGKRIFKPILWSD